MLINRGASTEALTAGVVLAVAVGILAIALHDIILVVATSISGGVLARYGILFGFLGIPPTGTNTTADVVSLIVGVLVAAGGTACQLWDYLGKQKTPVAARAAQATTASSAAQAATAPTPQATTPPTPQAAASSSAPSAMPSATQPATGWVCSSCGKSHPADSRYCGQCGEPWR